MTYAQRAAIVRGMLALTSDTPADNEIVAIFRDGRSATYTANVLDAMRTDSDVIEILDATTGEVIHHK